MPARIVAPLVGEPLPLDFVNTARSASGDSGDVLATAAGLEQWLLAESDRLPAVRVTHDTLTAVRLLRSWVAVLVDAARQGVRPPPAAIGALNDVLRVAPTYPQVSWGEGCARVDAVRTVPDGDAHLLVTLAEAAAEFLSHDAVAKIRECAAPDCALLFAATHPRRRWCSPTVCGNRTRVARYYERHRATP